MSSSIRPEHSPIGASSMYRWSECPASVKMSRGIFHPPSAYALEGTRAHELAAARLTGRPDPFKADDEMSDAVNEYILLVSEECHAYALPQVEVAFDLSDIYPGLYGTADCVVYHADKKLLRVYDYKHGRGIAVDAENNLQLQYYALGAMLASNLTGADVEEVEVVIVQPRCDHSDGTVRRWKFDSFALSDFAGELKHAAMRTKESTPVLKSGSHCRFCPAAGICPELKKKANEVAKTEFDSLAAQYDPILLGDTLSKLDALEDWISSVRSFAFNEAMAGRTPPGFKLVPKRAMRKWYDETSAAGELSQLTKDEKTLYEYKLKSPAQLEKLFPKAIFNSKIAPLIVKISSGETLVKEDDSRQAVKRATAAEEFDCIEGEK